MVLLRSHVEATNEPLTALELPPTVVAVLTDMLGFLACLTVKPPIRLPSTMISNTLSGSVVRVEAGTLITNEWLVANTVPLGEVLTVTAVPLVLLTIVSLLPSTALLVVILNV